MKIYFIIWYLLNLLSLTAACQQPSLIAARRQSPPLIAEKNTAIVPTTYGKVRGYIHQGIYTFKGIPYAAARRFMPPEKPSPWDGIRSSMTYGPTCPSNQQVPFKDEFEFPLNRSRGYYIGENCLNLNIWSKKITTAHKQPVMVWLHGGGFASGSSLEFPSYDGESLTRKGNVIVVSINHRLNVLGFLDLSAYGDKYKYSANVGMMDIVAALTWIRDNISNFGGDPDNVTIFGQSGGGAKAVCLMNAPSAKGLFHKAIVQSGSYLTAFAQPAVSRQVAAELLKSLGLQPDQVDSLQTMPYDRLDEAGEAALQRVRKSLPASTTGFGLEWEPVRDGDFLPYQPDEPQAMELSKNIPLLVGSCKNEFVPYRLGAGAISMDSAKARLYRMLGKQTTAYISAVKKAYPQTVDPSDYVDIDWQFRPLVIRQANQRSSHGDAPVYVYLFAWQSPVSDGAYKAFHCMDLPFVFNNVSRCEEMTGGGPAAYRLEDKVSEAWIEFARSGNPNNQQLPAWPAYTPANGATMIFDNECQVKAHFDQELLSIATGH
jgi:para-nitrobenzyl esterase